MAFDRGCFETPCTVMNRYGLSFLNKERLQCGERLVSRFIDTLSRGGSGSARWPVHEPTRRTDSGVRRPDTGTILSKTGRTIRDTLPTGVDLTA